MAAKPRVDIGEMVLSECHRFESLLAQTKQSIEDLTPSDPQFDLLYGMYSGKMDSYQTAINALWTLREAVR